MAGKNATTYNKILSKGIEANLPASIGDNKLRFTTDTGRLFLDNEGTERIEITDFIKGKTKNEIIGTLAPLPKFYLASDTQELYYFDASADQWKTVRASEAVNASTAQYAVEAGHSVNADTASFATSATNASSSSFATSATNASSASYSTNASSSSYSKDGIKDITRDGLTFTVKRNDNSTFTFTQQDNNTTYDNVTSATAGLAPAGGTGTTKYLRQDGSWQVPPNDNTTYTNGDGIGLSGNTFSNAGVREIKINGNNLNVNTNGSTKDIGIPYATNAGTATYATNASSADIATKDGSGNTITSTYAPKASPAFTGSPTTPDVTTGDSSTKIANTKFVGTAVANAIAGITQIDFQVVTKLPPTGVKGVIYLKLITPSSPETDNIYEEYIWLGSSYEKIGTTKVDLTGYINTVNEYGTGNAVTGFTKSGSTLTLNKNSTFLTAHPAVTHNSSTAAITPAAGSQINVISDFTTDDFGHASSFVKTTVTLPNSVNSATNASTANYSKNAISSITRSGNTFTATRFDGSTFTFTQKDDNTTYTTFTSTDAGLAPASGGGTTKYLRADGTWVVPPDNNTTYDVASVGSAGLMPALNGEPAQFLTGIGTWATPIGTTYDVASMGKAGLMPALNGEPAQFLAGNGSWGTPIGTTYDVVSTGAAGLAPKVTSTSGFLKGDGTWATPTNTTYANMTSASAGLAPAGGSGTTKYLRQDGTWVVPPNTTYSNFTSAAAGLAPASGGGTTKYLRADGSWQVPPDNNTTYDVASIGSAGLMPGLNGYSDQFLTGTGTWETPIGTTYDVASIGSAGLMPGLNGYSDQFLTGTGTWETPIGTTYDVASIGSAGLMPGLNGYSDQFLTGTGTWATPTNTTYANATTAAAGLLPVLAGGTTKYLRADGTWANPQDNNSTYALVEGTANGTVNFNDNGTTANIAVHGLKALAYKASLSNSDVGLGNVKNYDQSKAITSITRSGLTFTATQIDGSTFTFTQKDDNTTYAVATTAAAGLLPTLAGGTTKYLRADGSWQVPPNDNTTYANMTSAAAGLAPAGGSGTTKYLRQDGTWQVPPDNNTTYANVSTSAAGLAPKVTSTSAYLRGDGTWATPTNTTYAANTWATSAANGTSGIFNTIPPKDGYNTKFLRADGSWVVPTNTTYANATTAAAGLLPTLAGGTTKYLRADGSWQVPPDNNTTYGNMTSAAAGLAPAGGSGTTKYLRQDGSWQVPPNTTYANMTSATAGLAPAGGSGTTKYLRQDGSWQVPPNTGDTTYTVGASGEYVKLTASNGSTSRASLTDLINGLSEGTSAAQRDDYYVAQYAGGGTSTISYHRRKVSSLFAALNKSDITTALGYTPPTTNTTYANMTSATAGLAPAGGSGTTKYLRQDGTWVVPPNDNTTYAVVSTTANGLAPKVTSTSGFLKGDGTWATPTNTTYAVATTAAAGLIPALAGGTTKYLRADGSWQVPPDNNTTYANFTSAAAGLAPASGGGTSKYLRADGTWVVPPNDNTTYAVVSTTANGLAPKVTSTSGFLKGDGTWATPTNSTYALAEGTTNGTVKFTSNGSTKNVPVHGLQSAAYASSTSFIAASVKGAANGVAELGSDGKVPSSQLPSYVDDVVEGYYYNSKFYKESTHTTEIAGETGKIYVSLDTNKSYRWSGTAFVVIASDLALGETSSTAYRGDRGKIAYDHSQAAHAPSNAQPNQNAFSNIAVGSTTIAADTTTDTLTMATSGSLSITPDATNDKVTINHSTVVTAGTAGTSTATSGSTLAVPYVTYNNEGHITGTGTHTHTVTGFLSAVPAQYATTATYTGTAGRIEKSGTAFDLSTVTSASTIGPSGNVDGTDGTTMSVPQITVDKYGRVTALTSRTYTSRNTANTDTKVTAVGNHYTPATNNASSVSVSAASTVDATWGTTKFITGVTLKRDAAYHVTGIEVSSNRLPAIPAYYATTATLSAYSTTAHNHDGTYLKSIPAYYATTATLSAYSTTAHNHDGTYYKKTDTVANATNASTAAYATNIPNSALPNSGATSGSYGMSAATTGTNNTTISIPYITVNAKGVVTAISNKTYTAKDTTYSNMSTAEGTAGTATTSRVMTAANLKGILQGSTYIYGYAPCVEADFDFGELTANGETYSS